MSTTHFAVMYGIPFNVDDLYDLDQRQQANVYTTVCEFEDDKFVHKFYHGSLDYQPIAVGVKLGEFGEGSFSYSTTALTQCLTPSPEVVERFQKLFDEADEDLKKLIALFPNKDPRVYLLWFTS